MRSILNTCFAQFYFRIGTHTNTFAHTHTGTQLHKFAFAHSAAQKCAHPMHRFSSRICPLLCITQLLTYEFIAFSSAALQSSPNVKRFSFFFSFSFSFCSCGIFAINKLEIHAVQPVLLTQKYLRRRECVFCVWFF